MNNDNYVLIDAMTLAFELSGLSQTEIADRMNSYQSSISRMLAGKRIPSWKYATRFFRACGFVVTKIELEKIK